jgi:putative ABC transport system substrate-binding protein
MPGMRRRDFVSLFGGAAVAWPLSARAQQGERIRRIGVLLPAGPDDPDYQTRVNALAQGLAPLGWKVGRNIRMDRGDPELLRRYAEELVALGPDVLLASSSLAVAALQQATRTVPIVFGAVVDPIGAGFVASLSHPSGNTTGFTNFEYSLSGKWPELLREISPSMTDVAVFREEASPAEVGMLSAMQSASTPLGVQLTPVRMRDTKEIESAIGLFAQRANGGLIILGSALASVHRDLIIKLANQYRLPAAFSDRLFVDAGGLISYGPDRVTSSGVRRFT